MDPCGFSHIRSCSDCQCAEFKDKQLKWQKPIKYMLYRACSEPMYKPNASERDVTAVCKENITNISPASAAVGLFTCHNELVTLHVRKRTTTSLACISDVTLNQMVRRYTSLALPQLKTKPQRSQTIALHPPPCMQTWPQKGQ